MLEAQARINNRCCTAATLRMMESGCMASFSDVVEALPETEEVVVDQQAKACDAGGACLAAAAAATVTEESDEAKLQQEQHDGKAPVPDHQEVSAAPEHAAEAPAAAPAPEEEHAAEAAPAAPGPEEHGDEKEDHAVAKEEAEESDAAAAADGQEGMESPRERLKRHRREMAGRVWVPEMWGQEKLLKDWVDCAVFDRPMVPTGLLTARRALIAECCTRRPDRTTTLPSSSTTSSSPPLRVRNGCS